MITKKQIVLILVAYLFTCLIGLLILAIFMSFCAYSDFHKGQLVGGTLIILAAAILIRKATTRKNIIWVKPLKLVYKTFAQFENSGLAERLGFKSAQDVWEYNPLVKGSTNPEDYQMFPLKDIPTNVPTIREAIEAWEKYSEKMSSLAKFRKSWIIGWLRQNTPRFDS
jgi:hypothetical protein